VSELTSEEYIQLIANWEYLKAPKQYNCLEQREKLEGPRLESFINRNGCNRPTEKPRQTVGIINFHNCFCDHLHPNFSHLLWLHERFSSQGILPFPGCLSEQPNQIIEIFRQFDRLKLELEIEQQKKAERSRK
jgi:hypothetical protein